MPGSSKVITACTSLADSLEPAPLTTPEELALFMNLHDEMVYPGGNHDNAPMPMDFELLKNQFNHAVAQKWKEDPASKFIYKMKTATLLLMAYDRAAESEQCNKLIGSKKDLVIKLLSDLKDDSHFVFPDIKVRAASESEVVVPAPVGLVVPPPPSVVVAEEAVAMEVEVVVVKDNVEDWDWEAHGGRSTRQLKARIAVLKKSVYCPKCHLICKHLSSKRWKIVNGHSVSARKGSNAYPDCDAKGHVSKDEAQVWANRFRNNRTIKRIQKLIDNKSKKKKQNKQ